MALKVLMYSFKGGAGRTVSTANVARILAAEKKKRTVVIDLDVESAGLSVLFNVDTLVEGGGCGTIQDILRGSFRPVQPSQNLGNDESVDEDDDGDLVSFGRPRFPETWSRVHVNPDRTENLSIVPSRRILLSRSEAGPGKKPETNFGQFLMSLQAWIEGPEIILFDSASGIQNTALLGLNNADVLVVFVRWSRQFIFGTLQFLRQLVAEHKSRAPRRLSRIIVVPTAVPRTAPEGQVALDLADRRALLENRIDELNDIASNKLGKPRDWIINPFEIPESDAMKWDDCIISADLNDANVNELAPVLTAYRKLADLLVKEIGRGSA